MSHRLEAPKEKAVVNDGRGQRVLSNVYCLKQRLETSVAKGSVVAEQCDWFRKCTSVLVCGGFDVRGAIEAFRKRFQRFYVGARI
jgi:hypothetical protein